MGIVGTGCAITLLKAIHASADVFPPLKAIAGGTLYILETVQVSARLPGETRH
jgi:hypothetical protein